jgi:hypothetical protein
VSTRWSSSVFVFPGVPCGNARNSGTCGRCAPTVFASVSNIQFRSSWIAWLGRRRIDIARSRLITNRELVLEFIEVLIAYRTCRRVGDLIRIHDDDVRAGEEERPDRVH